MLSIPIATSYSARAKSMRGSASCDWLYCPTRVPNIIVSTCLAAYVRLRRSSECRYSSRSSDQSIVKYRLINRRSEYSTLGYGIFNWCY